MAPRDNSTEDLFQINLALASCWDYTKDTGVKDICYTFFIGSNITRPITEDLVKDAFKDGDLDNEWFAEEFDLLVDIWGGAFNLSEIDWEEDLVPGTAKEVCLWYEPGGFLSQETMVMDLCTNFTP